MPSPCWRIGSAGARLGKSILAGLWAAQGFTSPLGILGQFCSDHRWPSVLRMGKKRIECAYVKSDITVACSHVFLDKTEVFGFRGFLKMDSNMEKLSSNISNISFSVPYFYGNFHEENDDSSIHQWKTGRFPMFFDRAIWNAQDLPYFASKVQPLGFFMLGRAMAMAANMLGWAQRRNPIRFQ